MPRPLEALAQEVLRQPAEARDVAWDTLAARRAAEMDGGTVTAVPAEELLAQLRAELE